MPRPKYQLRSNALTLTTFPAAELVFDRADLHDGHIDEWDVITDLQNAIGDPAEFSESQRLSAWATVQAFRFQRPTGDNRWPWGIYWGALSGGTTEGGQEFYAPDVKLASDEVLQFWAWRASKVKHPAIRARFSDLVWEIGRWTGRNTGSSGLAESLKSVVAQPIELVRMSIDDYLTLVQKDWLRDEYEGWQLLSRAIELAAQVKDGARVAKAKKGLLSFLESKAKGGVSFQWWQFDEILWTHRKLLTSDERKAAIEMLEHVITTKSDLSDKHRFNPHDAKNAVERLARWMPQNERSRMRPFIQLSGQAFETAAMSGEALVAIAWLEDLIPFYRNAGMVEDAVRVEKAITSRAAQAETEFGKFEVSVDISKEKIEKWIDDTAGDSLEEGLRKIATRCLIREQSAKDNIVNMTRNAPLTAMMNSSIMGNDGFTVATVGSISDDLSGRSMQHAADLFNWYASWLDGALNRLKEKHGVNAEMLAASFDHRALFTGQQTELLKDGVCAWFAGDWVKAIHVLVPQVEAILREMLSKMGRSVRRYEPELRGFQTLGMGKLLHDDAMKTEGLRDVRFHFLALYADPRAINLRNKIAHGLARPEFLSVGVANWVIHSLLVLRSIDLIPQTSHESTNSIV